MTNDDVLFLAQTLGQVNVPNMEPEFNYAVASNLREAEKVAKIIQDAIKPGEDFKNFEKGMQKLREKHARKDDKGKPISTKYEVAGLPKVTYDIPNINDPNGAFNKAVTKIRDEFKETIENQEGRLSFLEKENEEIKLIMVDVSDIPKGLSRRAMDGVYLMTNKPEK